MDIKEIFSKNTCEKPFSSYTEYMDYLFACVNIQLEKYIRKLQNIFTTYDGEYKNVLYPDIEIAHRLTEKHLADFDIKNDANSIQEVLEKSEIETLYAEFTNEKTETITLNEMLQYVRHRAEITDARQVNMPFFRLVQQQKFSNFTLFCFACAVLSSTQTNYASVFQVVNQNANYPCSSIESAGRVFYGEEFSMSNAYAEMSKAIEQLAPIIDMQINKEVPFSTLVTLDKRMIDFLFGSEPMRTDPAYNRFLNVLTDEKEIDPFIANKEILAALNISYEDGTSLFNLYADEGAGKRFTIKHFCRSNKTSCVSLNCAKLFACDFDFVDTALWAVCRECVLTNAACALTNLSYCEEDKEKIFRYLDLAFSKLREQDILVFTLSAEKIPLREITQIEFTQMELPTPKVSEREKIWEYYSQGYSFADDVDLMEMAAKFLFTVGKIKAAIKLGRSLSAMARSALILRGKLFEACYEQMSHELTQKATKIKTSFTWEDIVMPADQRKALENACNQITFQKKVYEKWEYNRKYPYGKGLSVLLFGAPGTGKSMCAQVIANALNLELYRVDLSKVIDKYIGETEKSISMIFREAKKCNVVLFFDECDTLFAKRSDDGGSNQYSNNNRTALLLQEVEAYDGISVLATNYKHNVDPAFFRRMKYIVEFQFPDQDTREILWRTTIPKGTPLAADVDIRFLAERFEFVGGNIKNCILNAAFLAASDGDGTQVCMRHYLQAIRYEFVKTGKVFTRSDFAPYADMVM